MRVLRSGVTPHTAPRILHAFITLYNRYMKLFFAFALHAGRFRVRKQITKNDPKKEALV
jgi:hypothetical protein